MMATRNGGNLSALRHGVHSERTVGRTAAVQKRRLLRQIGLRASDLDGIGLGYLEGWARAQAKVELMDAWTAAHGWLGADGTPPPFVATYFAAVNSTRLALDRFSDHLKARGKAPSMVIHLQRQSRKVST